MKLPALHYKGYTTQIKYFVGDEVYYGKIENTGDLVLFETNHKADIEKEFHKAVDDYIEFRKKNKL